MKKVSLLLFSLIFLFSGYLIAGAQQNSQSQMQDMQQNMMKTMMEQMTKNLGGGMGGSAAPKQGVSTNKARGGESVFSDTSLGTNGKSCKTCHSKKGKKPLDGRKVDSHLISFVQYCYNNALKGMGVIPEKKLTGIEDYFKSLQR